MAAEQAQADAEQEKADRLFNKNARREQMADLKGRIARERREAQLRAERKAAERRVSVNKLVTITFCSRLNFFIQNLNFRLCLLHVPQKKNVRRC